MVQRKHITEMALSFVSRDLVLLHPKDIRRAADQRPEIVAMADACHIYFIVTRPRTTFVPDSLALRDMEIFGSLQYRRDGVVLETAFALPAPPDSGEVVVSTYPHTALFLESDGRATHGLPAYLACLHSEQIGDPALRNLKVQYIGMAFGAGDRSAIDRLQNHSTLQQILADLNHGLPDDEALLLLVEYDSPRFLIHMDGTDKSLSIEADRNVVEDMRKAEELLTEETQIALIEAGLIRYFRPSYNEKFKNRFPDRAQKLLHGVYGIDFVGLTVELNTEPMRGCLWSETRAPGLHHVAAFDLHDPSERRSYFDFLGTRAVSAETLSGPRLY